MHTFVIAWWDDEDQEPQSISLLVQPRSGLTSKFHELHMTGKYFTLIDGPYGPDNSGGMIRDLGDYGHLFMVATGIGIAAQIPYIKELLEAQRYGLVRTQRITLIWQSDMTRQCFLGLIFLDTDPDGRRLRWGARLDPAARYTR
jgi:NAD(P)H-flavin reductase